MNNWRLFDLIQTFLSDGNSDEVAEVQWKTGKTSGGKLYLTTTHNDQLSYLKKK